MAGYFLSEEDVVILRELVQWRKRQYQARGGGNIPELESSQAPATYVAYVSTTGIPALSAGDYTTGTGTGTRLGDDVPGSARCDVYQLVKSETPTLIPIGRQELVYNLGPVISGDQWIQITREAFGGWLALPPPASASSSSSSFSGVEAVIEHNVGGTTDTTVPYDSFIHQTSGYTFGGSQNRIVVPEAGNYQVGFSLSWYVLNAASIRSQVKLNGAAIVDGATANIHYVRTHLDESSNNRASQTRVLSLSLAASDYVELVVRHSDSFTATLNGRFWVHRLSDV